MTDLATHPLAANDPVGSRITAWMLVGTLFLANILNTLDRSLINFLVDPIRRDLAISDFQISLLQGISFSLFYVAAGVPLGMLADRVKRTRLLFFGLSLWSGATILSGFSPNYAWMFGSRLLVGAGEATLAPCAMSLISDSFLPEKRGRPIGIHLSGGAIAAGLSALLVGLMIAQVPRGTFDFVPGIAGLAPWRVAFIIAGSAGFVVAALLGVQREPRRRGVTIRSAGSSGLREMFAYLAAGRSVFIPLYLGFTAFSIGSYGTFGWAAVLLNRQYQLPMVAVSHALGLAFVAAGGTGVLLAGFLIDHPLVLRRRMAKFSLLAVVPLAMVPSAMATLAPTAGWAAVLLASAIFFGPMMSILMLSVLAEMMPNDMRGLSVALLGVSGTMIGGSLGPMLVALGTERLFGDATMVGKSVLLVAAPAMLAACYFFWRARTALGESLRTSTRLAGVMAADADRVVPGLGPLPRSEDM